LEERRKSVSHFHRCHRHLWQTTTMTTTKYEYFGNEKPVHPMKLTTRWQQPQKTKKTTTTTETKRRRRKKKKKMESLVLQSLKIEEKIFED